MNKKEIEQKLKDIFAASVIESHKSEWGIRLPQEDIAIQRVGWAASLTVDVVRQCIDKKIDLLITHHDAWEWLYELHEEVTRLLQAHKIGHLFVHGPLDQAADFGTAATILNHLGAVNSDAFCEEDGLKWGRIGELKAPTALPELEAKMSALTGEHARFSKAGDRTPTRVAVVTGGGCNTGYVREAERLGCDTFITGEYNCWFAMYAEFLKLNYLVYSHTFTERYAVRTLAELLFEESEHVEILELEESHV